MNTQQQSKALIAVTVFGLMAGGCAGASRKPIATSMADLAGESRAFHSLAVDYIELFAVNGAIMMPGTRMLTYYPEGGRTPAYMIGLTGTLAQATSRLTMKSTAGRTAAEVMAVKTELEKAQDAATAATLAQLELAAIHARQADPGQKIDDSAFTNQVDSVSAKLATAEGKLGTAVAEVRKAAAKPGIVIARWTATREKGGTGALGSIFSASGSSKSTTAGFVVMGNVEASMLIFGDDMRSYVKALDGSEKDMFKLLGISSYVLRAEHVAYTSSLDLESAFAASLSAKVGDLSSTANLVRAIDRVKISGYFAAVTSLENSGMVGPVEWELERTPVLKYHKLTSEELKAVGLTNPTETETDSEKRKKENKLTWVQLVNQPMEDPCLFDSQVLYAVPAKAPRVFKKWQNDTGSQFVKRGERWYALLDLDLRDDGLKAE